MQNELNAPLDGLLEKYTELLLGEATPELKEKVKMWVLYSHIAKSMPPLVKHWNETYPEEKEMVKELIAEIKQLNEQHRMSQTNKKRT
ncbi:YusU family protein [Metabacillus sp. JX24]|uniref:YusU family protein n=1 Tax=Metabacillus sp. JX24 TaxID=3240759 RepID=UPI0035101146